ncbi:hypothetical protein LY78DRAFT_174655 [Colletotrichum sublineola]|nr:hypothetical protein LY78DRAFT_174655 [Colletotrichum sublineola]
MKLYHTHPGLLLHLGGNILLIFVTDQPGTSFHRFFPNTIYLTHICQGMDTASKIISSWSTRSRYSFCRYRSPRILPVARSGSASISLGTRLGMKYEGIARIDDFINLNYMPLHGRLFSSMSMDEQGSAFSILGISRRWCVLGKPTKTNHFYSNLISRFPWLNPHKNNLSWFR